MDRTAALQRMRHYEEVSAEHLAFRQSLGSELRLRSWRRARVPVAEAVLDDEENAYRFLRTTHFLSGNRSCFNSTWAARRCCRQRTRSRSCFDVHRSAHLCCYSHERPEDRLFAPAPGRSATALEVRNCSALEALADAGILTWVEALLGLAPQQQGPCLAGSLAPRLARAPQEAAAAAMARLSAAWRVRCPARAAGNAARRNLLLWTEDSPHVAAEEVARALATLRHCATGNEPVQQLHVAKTAGTSLCYWANRSGFRSLWPAQPALHRCQLPGDGPFWLGET
ncbi:unnamed protein product [Durusdinium trenchii]|uniref:Uncharacterized protein n=1 Tax=Durusdinium trenchii TaxID=1381693 RepID=A0ABP0KP51_9DINO